MAKLSKSLLVNLVIVGILAYGGWKVYDYQMSNFQNLERSKELEIKKNALIENIGKLEKRMFAYKRLLYPKETGVLVNKITEVARKYGISINSLQPRDEEVMDYYTKIVISLNVVTRSYHDLGNFITELEKSPEIFNADVVNVQPDTETGSTGLIAEITVSTLIYKD